MIFNNIREKCISFMKKLGDIQVLPVHANFLNNHDDHIIGWNGYTEYSGILTLTGLKYINSCFYVKLEMSKIMKDVGINQQKNKIWSH